MNKKALLHLLNEFAPVIAFFITAQFFSFYTATGVLIVSTLLALAAGWYFDKRFPILPIISGFFVIISGLITIYYQAPDALIFADSLYYILMGITIFIGLLCKVNILKIIFERLGTEVGSVYERCTCGYMFVLLAQLLLAHIRFTVVVSCIITV